MKKTILISMLIVSGVAQAATMKLENWFPVPIDVKVHYGDNGIRII